jgi:D-alanyl-D-alanine carboxypeptidase/D-alanyl-D-alanine-endopeptidase (penicillin-binding protein 4)
LSAHQLAQVAQKFAPYSDLMPTQKLGIRAKSGTLNGISCYAGYVLREGEWLTFALLINQPVEYRFRERLAEQLLTTEF